MSHDPAFSRLLHSIGVSTTIKQITATVKRLSSQSKNLKALADGVEITPTSTIVDPSAPQAVNPQETNQEDLLFLASQMNSLTEQLNMVSELLARYEAQNDTLLPKMKRALDSIITDYKSAYTATVTYDGDWFANLLMSMNAKVEFASALLFAVKQFCNDNTKTLEMIADQNPEMIERISMPVTQADL